MGEIKCQECSEAAYTLLTYPTSGRPVRIHLCQPHARAWWQQWANTAAGQGATFSDVQQGSGDGE